VNSAPSKELLVIRRNHKTEEISLDPLRWGLIPIITTDANELVAEIHDRMPVILAPSDYAHWLSEEPDPRGLTRQFPGDLMRM
jgi:putative SOS response-associated peptidase YedK